MDFLIKIIRTSFNKDSTTGELFINDKFICHTLELPWQNNQSYISSIPSGKYKSFLRYDKTDGWRIQLENVPNRTGVQIHVGNYPSQIEGCVLVGEEVFNKENRIAKSTSSYQTLKQTFYGSPNPISSPDYIIIVEINYNVARTKFTDNSGEFFEYKENDLWGDKSNNKIYELKRDLQYMYFKLEDGTHFRIPIRGGIGQISDNISGPWTDAFNFKRQN